MFIFMTLLAPKHLNFAHLTLHCNIITFVNIKFSMDNRFVIIVNIYTYFI
jgi:hypothetical protein